MICLGVQSKGNIITEFMFLHFLIISIITLGCGFEVVFRKPHEGNFYRSFEGEEDRSHHGLFYLFCFPFWFRFYRLLHLHLYHPLHFTQARLEILCEFTLICSNIIKRFDISRLYH